MSHKTDSEIFPDRYEPVLKGSFATLGEAMSAAARQFGDVDAFVVGEQRLNYNQWMRKADGLATVFERRGIEPGDIVGINLPSSIDFAICYAAIIHMGAIVTGLNTRLGPREITAIIEKSSLKAIVTQDENELPGVASDVDIIRRSELPEFYKEDPRQNDFSQIRREDPAVIVWTSGTTGFPKGAWYNHSGLEAAVHKAGPVAAPYDRKLLPLPYAHAGFMAKVWEQVAFAEAYIMGPEPWDAAKTLDLVVKERVTVLAAVPTQWEKIMKLPETEKADLSYLRHGVYSTSPASPELIKEIMEKFGCRLIARYGMTEATSITGTRPSDSIEVLRTTVGRPQVDIEVLVTDDNGNELPQGEVGRIRTRSACVMRGYWNDPELTAEVLTPDRWFVTGDLGYVRKDGNLVLTGRASDMYIRGGYNVYPLEVENVLGEHPDVLQVAVAGVKTPVIGEIGVAFVVPTDPENPPPKESLQNWCKDRLADYKKPDEVVIMQSLPANAMMKVNKAALRSHFEEIRTKTTA